MSNIGRRFELHRRQDATGTSGTGVVAEGVQFRDGRVALRWLTQTASTSMYDSMEHVIAIHGHEGRTEVSWIDCPCEDGNPANLAMIQPGAGGAPRVAEVEICDDRACQTGHFLVRGDRVSFVSVEQRGRYRHVTGDDERVPSKIPSDIRIPPGYVLVNDPTGRLMSKCDVYVVRWRTKRSRSTANMHARDREAAREYFKTERLQAGAIEIPDGQWKRVARIIFIRYRRYGFSNGFQHRYAEPVDLFQSSRPLGWRLPLPEGCVIDSRGFVHP